MRVLIVGGGKVGTYLAERLLREKHDVRLIELREEEKERILLDIPSETLFFGSGTDPDVLEAAGIRKANVVAAVTGVDETNLRGCARNRHEHHDAGDDRHQDTDEDKLLDDTPGAP